MNWLRKLYPFNAEQTVNIMSEFGPLVAMFVVNAALPFVDIALRLSSTNSRALILFSGCAIVKPVANVYLITTVNNHCPPMAGNSYPVPYKRPSKTTKQEP